MSARMLLDAFRDFVSLTASGEFADCVSEIDWSMSERSIGPAQVKGAIHLDGISGYATSSTRALTQLVEESNASLHWQTPWKDGEFGSNFADNNAYVELFGTNGHFANDTHAGGFYLMGQGLHYPDHKHVAEEFYVPLTAGTMWSQDKGAFVEKNAGDLVFHESNEWHAMESPNGPLLALYIWRGGDLAQKPDY